MWYIWADEEGRCKQGGAYGCLLKFCFLTWVMDKCCSLFSSNTTYTLYIILHNYTFHGKANEKSYQISTLRKVLWMLKWLRFHLHCAKITFTEVKDFNVTKGNKHFQFSFSLVSQQHSTLLTILLPETVYSLGFHETIFSWPFLLSLLQRLVSYHLTIKYWSSLRYNHETPFFSYAVLSL